MRITAVILARNADEILEEAIKSVNFANEVIVIDDNSSDNTALIASKFAAKVFTRSLENDFAAQRNFGMEKARGEWVLFLDADERISRELQKEIIAEVARPSQIKGFYLKREDSIWRKKIRFGETGASKFLRLARQGAGRWKRKVHEVWNVEGVKETLRNPILHYPHQSLKEFIEEVNLYSTIHASENRREGKRSNLLKIIFWPKFKFFQNLIFRLGILDGSYGFILALVMSFGSFLSWAKLWIQQEQK